MTTIRNNQLCPFEIEKNCYLLANIFFIVDLAMTWMSSNVASIRCEGNAIRTPSDSKMVIEWNGNHKSTSDIPGTWSGLPRLEVSGFSQGRDVA